ncbi:cytochrome ubiquinol oxidase subunit I [Halosquirtibacter xylanolyticus]|uniref:cytochrome ubiquinol oxidase subunit I n=1 Tax=Halosquirtibacter xylanolyticus TaxID=3374599 RepID=UPI0037487BEB|nr:cytochrome ubiquinol oxidase subunit I [Prolixibacteraceae bacterium]
MIETLDLSTVDWSRAQFALTAMYHWLFVPLTLGITFLLAIMETIYYKTGNEKWKKATIFWMKLFGINFAIGVSTGIILEFEFGTNWSNYSWFVGDIFGAPLAIEGMLAFFMESTFIAVMFFGWNKVSKGYHLAATWLTAIGANLSALWILIANAWMQNPVGMQFNPDTARNEMVNFWDVALSPMAANKVVHTIGSGLVTGSIFILGISCWFLLRKREIGFAKRSILVASIFGLISSLFLAATGDGSGQMVAKHQPMKFAAMEGLYRGQEGAPLIALGVLSNDKVKDHSTRDADKFAFKLEIPKGGSMLAFHDANAYVPGVYDILDGVPERGMLSTTEKIERGREAILTLKEYKKAKRSKKTEEAAVLRDKFMSKSFQENYFKYFGYGYFKNPEDIIPNVPLVFYSFHIMVALGSFFIVLFGLALFLSLKGQITKHKWFYYLSLLSLPLVYVAGEAGWVVAEVGRQPWVIQDLMPTIAAVTNIDSSAVVVTFCLFAIVFTFLLIAEIMIMVKQIKIGPKQ